MAAHGLVEREARAWRNLMSMQETLVEFLERQLRNRSGLSRADYEVLAHLSEAADGRLRSFELGRLLRWEKSRLSQHLSRMQNRGLVERERCLSDQRGAVIAITVDGSALIEAAAPLHAADVRDAVVDHLSESELEALGAICGKVLARLAALEDPVASGQPASVPERSCRADVPATAAGDS